MAVFSPRPSELTIEVQTTNVDGYVEEEIHVPDSLAARVTANTFAPSPRPSNGRAPLSLKWTQTIVKLRARSTQGEDVCDVFVSPELEEEMMQDVNFRRHLNSLNRDAPHQADGIGEILNCRLYRQKDELGHNTACYTLSLRDRVLNGRKDHGRKDQRGERKTMTTTTATMTTREKVLGWESEAATLIAERGEALRGIVLAALAGEHVLMLGPPGEGKSLIARMFAGMLDGARVFEWLMTKYTTPEEVFGPFSIAGLKQDRFTRITTGKLADAEVAFLDEIFKSNSAILNALLSAINERVFHDGSGAIPIPLKTVLAASNELPEGAELGALWDRFLVRVWVKPVSSETGFCDVVAGARTSANAAQKITAGEWDAARAEVDAIGFPMAVAKSLFTLRAQLAKDGVEVSTRRWKKCTNVMRAAAWLDGCTEVSEEHIECLASCLWNAPEQMPVVAAAVRSSALSAEVTQALAFSDGVMEVIAKLPGESDPQWETKCTSAAFDLKKAYKKIADLRDKASTPASKARIEAIGRELQSKTAKVTEAARRAVG